MHMVAARTQSKPRVIHPRYDTRSYRRSTCGPHIVCAHARSSEIGRWLGASLSTALGDRVHARRDVLDILRVDARHREAAVARAEDVVLRRERVHLLRVRLQL